MSTPVQLSFPFPSLDFEGHSILTVGQIADKLGYTSTHILNLVDDGSLIAIDGKGKDVTRRTCRVAVEAYRAFVMARLTGPAPQIKQFIDSLPRHVRMQLLTQIKESLAS